MSPGQKWWNSPPSWKRTTSIRWLKPSYPGNATCSRYAYASSNDRAATTAPSRSRSVWSTKRGVVTSSQGCPPRSGLGGAAPPKAAAPPQPARATESESTAARPITGIEATSRRLSTGPSADDHSFFEELPFLEPAEIPRVEVGYEVTRDEVRHALADDGRHHEAVAHEAAHLIEVVDAVDRADDRVRVGGQVVAPRPLAQHLHAAERGARAQE